MHDNWFISYEWCGVDDMIIDYVLSHAKHHKKYMSEYEIMQSMSLAWMLCYSYKIDWLEWKFSVFKVWGQILSIDVNNYHRFVLFLDS